ncbi:MAG TPA: sulfotransferase [Thermoanaerobaculia bacterium]|nr:sulfotransferase [Thermoanaerobaculia bacterium]
MIRDLARSLIPMGQRNRIARARVWLRRPTGALRRLPDFLVLGAMRAGTSSLYRYLGAHPSVSPSLRKEVEYFTRWHHRGEGWYRAHFPLDPFGGGRRRGFEATPYYLCHPHAPRRARALLPEARFLVILRDPVARALSHHRHLRRLGIETLSFEDAIAREPERLAGEWERMLADPRYESRSHHLFSYLERGRYARQLERWFEEFPRERFLVLEHDELFRDPDSGFREVLSFLDLAPWSPPEYRNFSRTGGAGGSAHEPAVPDALRERLVRHFEPHNRELEALLGRGFAWSR